MAAVNNNNIKIDDAEFFLPSDFLSDELFDDYAEEVDDNSVSSLSSKLLHHSFFDHDKTTPKSSIMATSPQSTLCGVGTWSFSSSNGSPEGPSLVSSPPSTPFQKPRHDALDLLYKASNQVESLALCRASNQELILQQLQAARFYQLKRQQLLKQQQQYLAAIERQKRINAVNAAVSNAVSGAKPLGMLWPPLQKKPHQHGSGMTAVFLNGSKRQSNGTGVFLPRRAGAPNIEPRKKPGCSTVLLPAKVVQALNLNAERGLYAFDNDVGMGDNGYRRSYAGAVAASSENRLPQEWTY